MVADTRCVCGENPLWHPMTRKVYWTDIPRGHLYSYDPATGEHQRIYEGDVVGGFTIQQDGSLLLFMARGTVKLWRGGFFIPVIEEIPAERESRFNDVIADPVGRVFCGTMPTEAGPGRLYLLDVDGTLRLVLKGVETSNGLGFSPDRKSLYYTDSGKREIYRFTYHLGSGAISHRQLFVRVPEGEGVPDGMTVDAEGYVWSARWDGGCLVRYTPEGEEERRIEFPARKVSSVTFGGDDYKDMYVTTAGGEDRETEGPGAGALFRLRLGIRGVPEFPSRIGFL
ncbi:MAG: SMP-30/gluconolactonase/LRE family protein [Anaerolineae bacterium]|nr:SMP-30/gluconolactonase/LRE family protein [Anaerolineae bacterium]